MPIFKVRLDTEICVVASSEKDAEKMFEDYSIFRRCLDDLSPEDFIIYATEESSVDNLIINGKNAETDYCPYFSEEIENREDFSEHYRDKTLKEIFEYEDGDDKNQTNFKIVDEENLLKSLEKFIKNKNVPGELSENDFKNLKIIIDNKDVKIKKCHHCGGSGEDIDLRGPYTCPICNGTGKEEDRL